MAINIDPTRPFVSHAQKRELIEAVSLAAASESEPDWLEWKSTVNLSEKRWQFEIARFVLGAANRLPDRATRAADGHGYMLLGVEPRNLCGVERVDNAQLEQGVSAYTGHDGPHWSPEYIDVRGVDVLVVTIAPPKPGDRIFTLAKEWDIYRNGAVFVRRAGKTEHASSAEMRQLEARLLDSGTRPQLDIAIELDDPGFALTPIDLSDASVDEWIALERRRLARPKPAKPQPDQSDPFGISASVSQFAALQDIVRTAVSALAPLTQPEDRKPEEYDAAVEGYLASARAGIVPLSAERAVASRLNVLRLAVRNQTADNYEEVAVILHLSGDVWAYGGIYEAEDAASRVESPPRKWGPRTVTSLSYTIPHMPDIRPIRLSRPAIHNDGSATIAYPSIDLRPEAVRSFEAIFVVAASVGAGELVAEWQATSSSVSGVARGKVTIPVAEVISVLELFKRPARHDSEG